MKTRIPAERTLWHAQQQAHHCAELRDSERQRPPINGIADASGTSHGYSFNANVVYPVAGQGISHKHRKLTVATLRTKHYGDDRRFVFTSALASRGHRNWAAIGHVGQRFSSCHHSSRRRPARPSPTTDETRSGIAHDG